MQSSTTQHVASAIVAEDDVEYWWTNAAEDYDHDYGNGDTFSEMPLDIKSLTYVSML